VAATRKRPTKKPARLGRDERVKLPDDQEFETVVRALLDVPGESQATKDEAEASDRDSR
jgi:hypothetical protein